jgi:hypothetical protein
MVFEKKKQNGGDIVDGTEFEFSGFLTINPVAFNEFQILYGFKKLLKLLMDFNC